MPSERAAPRTESEREMRAWRCPICAFVTTSRAESDTHSVRAHEACGWVAQEAVEVVRRSVAEALAEALSEIAAGAAQVPPYQWSGRKIHNVAETVLAEFRAGYPKEPTRVGKSADATTEPAPGLDRGREETP